MSHEAVDLDPRKLLNAFTQNLNHHFFAETRNVAKLLFKQLLDGEQVAFMHIQMEDGGEIHCTLSLDVSEYVGKINFGRFRQGLAMMMLGITKRLEAEQDITAMKSQSGEILFNIPGILNSEDGTNVIVCGLRQSAPGHITMRLMYLNPESYAEAAIAGREKSLQDPESNPNQA